MPDGLYERDILVWSERQGDLLRRIAAGERVNEDVDWLNVIEEVQDVGRSELRAVRSLLVQSMVHLLKLHAWPGSAAAAHWHGEARGFLASARRSFSPSCGNGSTFPTCMQTRFTRREAGRTTRASRARFRKPVRSSWTT